MSIHLGKILIKLKSVARKTGEGWGEWAAKHLQFIKPRTREKFMNLAKRRDCHIKSLTACIVITTKFPA